MYENLVLRNVITEMPPQQKLVSKIAVGDQEFWKDINGAAGNFALYYILRAGMFPEPPHSHTNDEFLYFISSNPKDMKNLGAVVEIAFGEEWEKVTFSESCLVKFPKELVHCPIHVRKLDRPFLFGHFWPMNEKVNMTLANGEKMFVPPSN